MSFFHSLFLLFDTFSYTLLLSKDMGDGTSQGSCVDNEDFIDPQGYSCSDNKDVNCLAEETFTRWGYSRVEWQDIVQNCPTSCRLCPGEIPFTVMVVQVYSHPHVSDGCLLMNGSMLVTFSLPSSC
jgi:hypothetical protein